MGGWFPADVTSAFILLFATMLCWGSWANSMKKTGKWRFESYYITYAIGIFLFSLAFEFTLGMITSQGGGNSLTAISHAGPSNIFFAFLAGAIWNLGNILTIIAIVLVGFAFAFPIGIGLSLVIGSVLSYIVDPHGIAFLEFSGLALITLAIIVEALAYHMKDKKNAPKEKNRNLVKGLVLCIGVGILVGLYSPLFALSITGAAPLDGYGALVFYTLGALVCTLIVIPILMKHPLIPGETRISLGNWLAGKASWHMWALAAAAVWAVGTIFYFISAPVAGVTISYILGQCAALVAAIWGIFVWKEFKGAPRSSWILVGLMFLLFLSGIYLTVLATG